MNLREKRLEKGMTQQELADKAGVLNTAICNYETGIREPDFKTLINLSAALDCTIDELIRDPRDNGELNGEPKNIEEPA